MKRIILLVAGVAMIGFGGYRQVLGSGVPTDDQARCEQLVREQNGDSAEALAALLPKCTDPGMVAMMDSQSAGDDAAAAARRISTANQGDYSAHLVDWALIGAGLVALAGAATVGRRRA